jgi:hypothetical protein
VPQDWPEKVNVPAVGTSFYTDDETHGRIRWNVGPKCEHDNGRWFCTTHDKMFGTPIEFWHHIEDGKAHAVVWWCVLDGPEVP